MGSTSFLTTRLLNDTVITGARCRMGLVHDGRRSTRFRASRQITYGITIPSPTWLNLVRSFLAVELREELVDLSGYGRGGMDGLASDGQFESAVALERSDQAFDR